MSEKKTLGIIGGMGPMATAALFQKIVSSTDAQSDADHIHILIDNYPQIPDRTQAILHHSDEPIAFMVESGKRLAAMGADILMMPCNTAHYFYSQVQAQLNMPMIHLIRETALECKQRGFSCIGILATDGTRQTGIFNQELGEQGLRMIFPSEAGQRAVMRLIYEEIKAGKPAHPEALIPHLKEMQSQGAEAFILGCTELPLAIRDQDFGFTFLDNLEILARRAVAAAGYPVKQP